MSLSPLVGRVVDKFVPWYATLFAMLCLLGIASIQVGAVGVNVGAVVVVALGEEMFRQMIQVSMAATVFSIEAAARARLNAVLILFVSTDRFYWRHFDGVLTKLCPSFSLAKLWAPRLELEFSFRTDGV